LKWRGFFSYLLRQAEVKIYRGEINAKFCGNFEKPVVYYGQFISMAFGRSDEAGINARIIIAKQLEEIAAK